MKFWPSSPRPRLHLGSYGLPFLRRSFTLAGNDVATHKHVMGVTGQGKSKALASMFVQLVSQGIPCALIDPHADLANDVLSVLLSTGYFKEPTTRDRLLFIDFSRQDAFLPFNVLHQPYEAHAVAQHMAEVCKRAWPALSDGAAPQFENILLASVFVLVENELPLTMLPTLVTDRSVREQLLRRVSDPHVVDFFHSRFDQWGKETPLMIESTLRRVFLLTFSPTLRYSLGQPENVLNYRALMDSKTSAIFNLGGLDEDTQRFLGCLLTVGFEVAALSRADMPVEQRSPYHLILDEFSMFSAQSEEALARVLSLARKYGLFLTMAHQTWSQLSERLQGAMQNCLEIAFKLGRKDAEWAAPRFGVIDTSLVKHKVEDERQVERTHPVFYSLPEQWERWCQALEALKPREAFVSMGKHTTKIRTRAVPPIRCSPQALTALKDDYAKRLMRPRNAIQTLIDTPTLVERKKPQRYGYEG